MLEAAHTMGLKLMSIPDALHRAQRPLRRGEKLRDKIEAQLAAIKRMPQLVRSFFHAPTVTYITDW